VFIELFVQPLHRKPRLTGTAAHPIGQVTQRGTVTLWMMTLPEVGKGTLDIRYPARLTFNYVYEFPWMKSRRDL